MNKPRPGDRVRVRYDDAPAFEGEGVLLEDGYVLLDGCCPLGSKHVWLGYAAKVEVLK